MAHSIVGMMTVTSNVTIEGNGDSRRGSMRRTASIDLLTEILSEHPADLNIDITMFGQGEGADRKSFCKLIEDDLVLDTSAFEPNMFQVLVGSQKMADSKHVSKPASKPARKRKNCGAEGCSKRARAGGFCISHGGGKKCAAEGCKNSSQGGGFCIKHGGGRRCEHQGCPNAAQSRGLCKKHGGGKRCSVQGCPRVARKYGYCTTHANEKL